MCTIGLNKYVMERKVLFLWMILSIICSCKRGFVFDFQAEEAKTRVIDAQDVDSYSSLDGYYSDSERYLEKLPYDLIMSNDNFASGNFNFYTNYIRIRNSGKFERTFIKKLDIPEKNFLIYFLKKGALKDDMDCQIELFHIYNEGIGIEKDIKKADSLKALFPEKFFPDGS